MSHNGYIYCTNNPVNMIDEDGKFPIALPAIFVTAIKAVVYAVATVITAITTAVVTENVIKHVKDAETKKNEKSHTVYKLIDEEGDVQYVGRTVNEKARSAIHGKVHPNLKFVPIVTGLKREEARGVEQIYMVEYNTKAMLNKINGISPNNKNLETYMEAGRQLLHLIGNKVSNEALYWTGK